MDGITVILIVILAGAHVEKEYRHSAAFINSERCAEFNVLNGFQQADKVECEVYIRETLNLDPQKENVHVKFNWEGKERVYRIKSAEPFKQPGQRLTILLGTAVRK